MRVDEGWSGERKGKALCQSVLCERLLSRQKEHRTLSDRLVRGLALQLCDLGLLTKPLEPKYPFLHCLLCCLCFFLLKKKKTKPQQLLILNCGVANKQCCDSFSCDCSTMLNSKGTQPYIYVYPFFTKLFYHPGCHIMLSKVPCAIQQVLVGYPFYIQQWVHVDPKLLNYPFPASFPLATKSL